MRSLMRVGGVLGVCASVVVVLAGVATGAGKVFQETIHDEFVVVDDDFCGAGLEVEAAVTLDLRIQAMPRGADQLIYFMQHVRETDVLTNLANGRSITSVAIVTDKDLRVTDNGDGTLTVLILATGNGVVYGEDGKAIGRNPGQIRIELLVDHGGTPTDPEDDVVLSEELVKGSTGRSDDFCAVAVPALTG